MPKHDFTPAMSLDKLEGYITYLKGKIELCLDVDKKQTYKDLYNMAWTEYLVALRLDSIKMQMQMDRK